ncbi:MAG: ABC transporter ATP-binding protein [Bacteriovorax sp.]|nr:ABC transporter ATP-binding protein [Bacteriovorax sp.]
MKNNLLELQNLSIGFNKKSLFENINAQVSKGMIIALMGANGAGKSCLLKTLAHLIAPIGGDIKIHDKSINVFSSQELARFISIVLTEKIQVDFLKVVELISLGRSPYTNWLGDLNNSDKKIVSQVMDQVGVFDLAEHFYSDLSDGQKQKVLIARALAQQPEILILDEPTTYLDIPSKVELLKLLQKISKESNMAIIMSSHDLDLIESKVDEIWLMGKDGSFNIGSPENCRSTGLFDKHFYF